MSNPDDGLLAETVIARLAARVRELEAEVESEKRLTALQRGQLARLQDAAASLDSVNIELAALRKEGE